MNTESFNTSFVVPLSVSKQHPCYFSSQRSPFATYFLTLQKLYRNLYKPPCFLSKLGALWSDHPDNPVPLEAFKKKKLSRKTQKIRAQLKSVFTNRIFLDTILGLVLRLVQLTSHECKVVIRGGLDGATVHAGGRKCR